MTPEKLINWVVGQKDRIETAIVASVDTFITKRRIAHPYSNVVYDLQQAQKESLLLGQGKDLCYDRFTTGALYNLFYQGRRINTSLKFAASFVSEAINDNKPIEVFDLGAGAGAVHLAVALCVDAALSLGVTALPTIRLINVDISPVMLDFAANYSAPAFAQLFPKGFNHVIAEYESVSWTNSQGIEIINPIIVASYVFDHSDNKDAVAKTFRDIVEKFDPEQVVLTTSWKKQDLVESFSQDEYLSKNFIYEKIPFKWDLPIKGGMELLKDYRKELNSKFNIGLNNHHLVSWNEKSFYGAIFRRRQARMAIAVDQVNPPAKDKLDLYQSRVKIRRDLVLSKVQLKAAKPDGRPTIILGSAGSGKSVVITERIKEIVEETKYSPQLNILLTTFNKSLVAYLIGWLKNLLDEDKYTFLGNSENGRFRFAGSNQDNITVLNFDKLPTQIGGIHGSLVTSKFGLQSRMKEAVRRVTERRNISPDQYLRILDPDFLQLEYIRVVYGLLYLDVEKYQESNRYGRGNVPRLRKNSEERAIIWDCVREYLVVLTEGIPGFPAGDTIYTRRQKLFRLLEEGMPARFTHIFVDEFQDCTLADYQLFYGLAKDNNEVVLTGDYAQAVHLGASSDAPKAIELFDQGKKKMGRRNIHHLKGSYRLPFRITECIRPLSEHINNSRADLDVNIINPYRGAPPGARPILVYGRTETEMVNKLSWIHHHFQIFNLEGFGVDGKRYITILENDTSLCNSINKKYTELATTDTILRLKGMEKDCIVWSTRAGINTPGDEDYFVYTILTRTRSILIIAMFDETIPRYREIVKLFPQDRLMIWDEETQQHYNDKIMSLPSVMVSA